MSKINFSHYLRYFFTKSYVWPLVRIDHLIESSHRGNSNKWSNIEFGEEIGILKIKVSTLSGALIYFNFWHTSLYSNLDLQHSNHNSLSSYFVFLQNRISLQTCSSVKVMNYIYLWYMYYIWQVLHQQNSNFRHLRSYMWPHLKTLMFTYNIKCQQNPLLVCKNLNVSRENSNSASCETSKVSALVAMKR